MIALWHRLAEILPEKGKYVLLVEHNGAMHVAHWTHLPTAPKEVLDR